MDTVMLLFTLGLVLGLAWLFSRPLFNLTCRFNDRLKVKVSHVRMDVPAGKIAQIMVDGFRLSSVVRMGKLGDVRGYDFYDSDTSLVHLTTATASGSNLLDGFVAAHEVGHAVTDHSSGLVKLACDTSAHALSARLTAFAVALGAGSLALGWDAGVTACAALLCVQLVASVVIQWCEARASHYALMVIDQLFALAPEQREALIGCARAAQTTQTVTLGRSAALMLVFGQLSALAFSPLLVLPVAALGLYAYLFVSSFMRARS